MISKPSFDVELYTKQIEGTPFIQMNDDVDVPDEIRASVEQFVIDMNTEVIMHLGGDSL